MGIWLLATFANLTWRDIPLVAICLAAGTVIYVSSAIVYASLAFWFTGARSFARDLTDFMLLFSSYPGSIYTGATKVVAYTILPAGFIVLAPVTFLRTPSAQNFAMIAAPAILYVTLALLIFNLGLRRYRQGKVSAG